MADVTQELMYELMKRMQADLTSVKESLRESRQDTFSVRNHLHVLQGDMNNLHVSIGQILDRLDRIESRLELRELAEAQARFEPRP